MQTINAKYTPTKRKGAQEVSLYIEGLAEFVSLRDAMVTAGVMKPAS